MDFKSTLEKDIEKLNGKLTKNEKQIELLKKENESIIDKKKMLENYLEQINSGEIETL